MMTINFNGATIKVDVSIDFDSEGAFQDIINDLIENYDCFECEECETFYNDYKRAGTREPVCEECVKKALIFLDKMTTIDTKAMNDDDVMTEYWRIKS